MGVGIGYLIILHDLYIDLMPLVTLAVEDAEISIEIYAINYR